jgi:hypothetical protein
MIDIKYLMSVAPSALFITTIQSRPHGRAYSLPALRAFADGFAIGSTKYANDNNFRVFRGLAFSPFGTGARVRILDSNYGCAGKPIMQTHVLAIEQTQQQANPQYQ